MRDLTQFQMKRRCHRFNVASLEWLRPRKTWCAFDWNNFRCVNCRGIPSQIKINAPGKCLGSKAIASWLAKQSNWASVRMVCFCYCLKIINQCVFIREIHTRFQLLLLWFFFSFQIDNINLIHYFNENCLFIDTHCSSAPMKSRPTNLPKVNCNYFWTCANTLRFSWLYIKLCNMYAHALSQID